MKTKEVVIVRVGVEEASGRASSADQRRDAPSLIPKHRSAHASLHALLSQTIREMESPLVLLLLGRCAFRHIRPAHPHCRTSQMSSSHQQHKTVRPCSAVAPHPRAPAPSHGSRPCHQRRVLAGEQHSRRKSAYRPAGGLCANEPCPGAEIRGEEQRSPARQPGLPCNASAGGFREQSCPVSTRTSSSFSSAPSFQHDVVVGDSWACERAVATSHCWPRHILRWFM